MGPRIGWIQLEGSTVLLGNACFFDLFNDGSAGVYLGNGSAVMGGVLQTSDRSYAQRDSVVQWSPAAARFTDISDRIGPAMEAMYTTRGVAVGDYDNDGAVDVLVSNNDGPARLLRNVAAGINHWLMVRCVGPDGTDAIGAKVLVTVAGKTRRRGVIVNYSYASACDPRIHFGLGGHAVADRVAVRWPGGSESVWNQVPADPVLLARQR